MPLDPNKLSRNELVQLVNSTSLGESLTRGRLNSQMNRAGRRWHDGRNIRLLDYLRWLVREVERPAKPRIDGRTADHARLATVAGDKGAMTLFGKKPEQHRLFAEHVADAETYVVTAGQGRTVHEWRPKPSKPDNHWLDCLVGCAVAASMAGVKSPGETAVGRQRKKYTQADLQRRGA